MDVRSGWRSNVAPSDTPGQASPIAGPALRNDRKKQKQERGAKEPKGGNRKSKSLHKPVTHREHLMLPSVLSPRPGMREHVPLHIPDWVLGAQDEVSMAFAELSDESPALREFSKLLDRAGRKLQNDGLWMFRDAIVDSLSITEFSTKALLVGKASRFGQTEISWMKFWATAKETCCRALFLGSLPPSQGMCGVFESHSWLTTHSALGTNAFRELLHSADGPVDSVSDHPRFNLVYINDIFETLWGCDGQGSLMEAGTAHYSPPLGPHASAPRPFIAESNLKRLRDVLYVALACLQTGGALIMRWSGLPYHPTLIFLMSHLRASFRRLHLVSSEDAGAYVLHILAMEHDRGNPEDYNSGHAKLCYFLRGSRRSLGCDDVLCWCLPQRMMMAEHGLGRDGYEKAWGHLATLALGRFEEYLPKQSEDQWSEHDSVKLPGKGDTLRHFLRRSATKFSIDGSVKLPTIV
eukprot:TRINITY_DN29813_c0_g1_i1.p1 TRINITY_DN29813_c0_g1~~TRINITY_DN29813_c0_g1_i1.p1  ORF type:complete len:465 (+),score=38.26 TRINITY_DN29813_c0_g1_i1:43-1437(+)